MPSCMPSRLPLGVTVRQWVEDALRSSGSAQPAIKRIALLLTGLVAGEPATVSGLSRTIHTCEASTAREPSIARRLLRTLADPRLDPAELLPAIFRRHLPDLLAGLVNAHAANQRCPDRAHARFRPVRLVVDETSQEDAVHLLVVGLWYQGLVLPLAVRAWPQNTPLDPDEYWVALGSLCWEVHGLLPPVLREHVLLLADRGYGSPRLLDLLASLGWAFVLRLPGAVRVRFPTGEEQRVRDLVPTPGKRWGSEGSMGEDWSDGQTSDGQTSDGQTLELFKRAGWRRGHVVGIWLEGQTEPWLLVTNLGASRERVAEYAQRWAIERLFVAWKSHGWDLEACRVRDPARLGRLVGVLVLATWWRLACAQPLARAELARLAGRPSCPAARQLPLPLAELAPTAVDRRPWPAKFSLLTWGSKAVQGTDCRHETPALDWCFSDWDAPAWPHRCELARGATT